MTVKRNIITAGTIAVVAGSILFTAGQKARSKPQANWNREQWLHLLSGSNGVYPSTPKARHNAQPDWRPEHWLRLLSGSNETYPPAPEARHNALADWRPEPWLRLLSGSNGGYPTRSYNAPAARNGQVNRPGKLAEFIGRTGYVLYR